MTVYYADTSALVRAYVVDEPDHAELRGLLLEGDLPVTTSELTRVELASAVASAARAGRLRRPQVVLDRFDGDCGDDGPVTMLRLEVEAFLAASRDLLLRHQLGTLDAMHLAAAMTTTAAAGNEPVCLVTRDDSQAAGCRPARARSPLTAELAR